MHGVTLSRDCIDAKTVQENFITIDGNKIRYLEFGKSKHTLTLIHGLGASAERWLGIIPTLAEHYRIIVPDLVGFGYSDKPAVDYTPEFFTDFLAKFFEALDINGVHMIGSSLGGQIAVDFTSAHDDFVKKLILVSPSGMMKHSTSALDVYIMAALFPNENNAKRAFTAMEHSGKKIDNRIIRGFVERMKLPNAKRAFMSTLLGLKESDIITAKLKNIMTPTLLVWGENDPVIPIKYADMFVSSMHDCKLHVIAKCGHTPYVQYPDKFSSIVLEFLNNSNT